MINTFFIFLFKHFDFPKAKDFIEKG